MSEGYVVYDCDIGTDDAWGLLMLIKGEERDATSPAAACHRRYKILGVTCVHGNTDAGNAAKNALRVLDAAERKDIPVFKGCNEPILRRTWERKRFFHGADGFGDLQHDPDVDIKDIRPEHAVNAMYEFACKHPGMVDYILVGPLTNFAACINLYGSEFLDKVRHVYVMGGNCRGKGNITKSAEFNFMMDPEAAHIVLERMKTPLLIVPWETCIDGDHDTTMEWRLDVLGAAQSRAMQLLTRVERHIFVPRGFVNWIVCDAMAVAAYVFPRHAIDASRPYHVTVELTGTHTRGQMVLDHLRQAEHNATIVLAMHKHNYKNILAWTAGVEDLQLREPQT